MVLDSSNGDLITEQTYVDVLDMSLVRDQVLVMLNNQVGDFRTRISVYDLSKDSNIFENERVIFQVKGENRYHSFYFRRVECLTKSTLSYWTEFPVSTSLSAL